MKVKDMMQTLEKVMVILKHYENYSADEMLDNIIKNLPEKEEAKENPVPTPKVEQQTYKEETIDYLAVISKLEAMDKDNMASYLKGFKKAELVEIGQCIHIELKIRETKKTLIENILNHYSFIRLNEQIANRNK